MNIDSVLTELWEKARVTSGSELDYIVHVIECLRFSGALDGTD